jgi:hypothetical protein
MNKIKAVLQFLCMFKIRIAAVDRSLYCKGVTYVNLFYREGKIVNNKLNKRRFIEVIPVYFLLYITNRKTKEELLLCCSGNNFLIVKDEKEK